MRIKKLASFIMAMAMVAGMSVNGVAIDDGYYEPGRMPRTTGQKYQLSEAELDSLSIGEAVPLIEKKVDNNQSKEEPNTFSVPTNTPLSYTYDSRVVKLKIDFGDGNGYYWHGTGFMYGPDVVGTVAHNFKHPTLGEAKGITGYIGLDSTGGYWEKFEIRNTSRFMRPSNWDSTNSYIYDYGAIKLTQPLGNTSGWFGYGVYSDSVLSSITAKFIGYATRQNKPMGSEGNLVDMGTYDFYYSLPASSGDSGSPIYRTDTDVVVGIHAYGANASTPLKSATRITTQVFNDLKSYKNS